MKNEFENLLDYLDKNKVKVNKPSIIKKEVVKNKPNLNIEEYRSIRADIPQSSQNNSEGFDVDFFKGILRKKLIDKYYKMMNYERPYISVSELLDCPRKIFYTRLKYPVEESKLFNWPYLYLIQKIGDDVHNILQSLIGYDDIEKTIKDEDFKVKGRIDAIKGNYLIEFKTIDDKKFKNEYLRNHYHQGLIYTYILNKNYEKEIDTITIVYVLRSLSQIHSFDVPYDEEIAKDLLNNAIHLRDCLESKMIPSTVKDDCKYCLYKKYCDKEEEKPLINEEKNDSVFLL